MGSALMNTGDDSLMFVHGEEVHACVRCGVIADYQCDYIMPDGRTCDLNLCGEHAIRQSGDAVDFCPSHHAECHGPDEPAIPRLAHADARAAIAYANRTCKEKARKIIEENMRVPLKKRRVFHTEDIWLEQYNRALGMKLTTAEED